MPYLLLIAGLLVGILAFLKFFIKAEPRQIKQFFLTLFFGIYTLALFELAMTERIGLAILFVVALVPFIIAYFKQKAKNRKN